MTCILIYLIWTRLMTPTPLKPTTVIVSSVRVAKRFFHTCENRFVQSARACVYIPANSFTTGKVSARIFSSYRLFLLALSLFYVYIGQVGQFPMFTKIHNAMKTKRYVFGREIYSSKRHASYTKTNSYVSCIYIQFLRFLKTQTLYFSLI